MDLSHRAVFSVKQRHRLTAQTDKTEAADASGARICYCHLHFFLDKHELLNVLKQANSLPVQVKIQKPVQVKR